MKNSNLRYLVLRYGFAVASIALAIWVRLLLDPALGNTLPYATLFVAVMLTAWYGGLRPALLAVVLGAFAANYILLPPRGSLSLVGVTHQVGALLYLAVGFGIAVLGGAMHRARQSAETAAGALRESKTELEARVRERTAELARTNESMRISEARMAGIVNAAMDAIVSVDGNQKIVMFNVAAEKMFRRSAAEVTGQSLDLLIPVRFREQHHGHIEGFGETGVSSRSMHSPCVLSGRRSDGEEFPVEASISQVEVGGEKIFTVILRDINERDRAEKALQASELRYRRLFESAQDGILILDAESGKIVDVNPFITNTLGYSKEELVGKALWEIGFFRDVLDSKLAFVELQEKGYIRYEDLPLKTRDGHIKQVEFVSNSYQAGGLRVIQCNIRDITERKRAEEILRESEANFKELFDEAPVAYHELDRQGRISRVNLTEQRLLGYSAEEMQGRFAWEFSVEKASQEATERKLSGKGTVQSFERTLIRKDGTLVPVEVEDRLLYDVDGNICGIRSTLHDITERKQAEAALRERIDLQEQLAQIAATSPGVLYSFKLRPDGSSCFPYASAAVEDLFGFQAQELAKDASKVFANIHPDDIDHVQARIAESARTFSLWSDEFRFIHARRGEMWVLASSVPQREPDGSILWRGFAMDITARKRTEADLLRLAAAVEQTADSVVITDPEGKIQYVNPAFERITGYGKQEVLNQNPRLLKSGKTDPAVYRELWKTITRGEVWAGQLTNRKKDGTLFHEHVTISPVHDKTDRIVNYIAVKQDISDFIQLEDQLRQSQKMEAIGQLAGGVAHDFNNLLTAITGYSSLALQRTNEREPIRGYLEEIKKAGDRAANLTRQLLAFGRKQMLQPVALSLNDVVADLNKMLRRLIGEDVRFTTKFDPALKKIKADAGQIEQVIVNLVVNARDAMPHGGNLTIETSNFEVDGDYASNHVGVRPGSYAMLAVSDTGVGMDDETRARIFEPFFTTKEKGKGTGLGLSTVYGIVKQSGGNIWVYSEPNQGTVFKVYLPQLTNASDPTETATVETPVPRGSETILLVEDEDVVRSLAQEVLEQAGYRVFSVSRGNETLRLFQESAERIDLLLTDVVMPEMSGKELAERLADLRPAMRVLFMSGYTDEAIVHHGIVDSDVQFIQKPFSPESLAKKIREVLD